MFSKFIVVVLATFLIAEQVLAGDLNGTTVSKGNDDWPKDLPLAWNWCALGYCSPIKFQCGGSCVNTAKLEVIETRFHMNKHKRNYEDFIKRGYNMEHYKAPPKIKVLSLQHFEQCKFVREYLIDQNGKKIPSSEQLSPSEVLAIGKGTKLVPWLEQYGAFSEDDFPRDGTCGMCGYKNCTDVECMLNHLPDDCSNTQKRKAQTDSDPCQCVKAPKQMAFSIAHDKCHDNLMKRHFDPCNCETMMHKDNTKAWHSAEDLKRSGLSDWFNGPDTWPGTPGKDSSEPKDAPYARTIMKDGPVTDHVWYLNLNPDPKKASQQCPDKTNHEIFIAGWNRTDPEKPYWIIRNSWSDGWGDNGYGYISMDCPCKGKCGGLSSS